ncbi:hypothetical protein FQN54_002525 [Arachnomyces sp. PD_36]|nr:hypothetical protein FQN54_002525 [Arachnomyces sp. PD_36]
MPSGKITPDSPPTHPVEIDYAAHARSQGIFEDWVRKMEHPSTEAEISNIVQEHTKEKPDEVRFHAQDTYNRSYRVKFNNGIPDVLVKFAAEGRCMLPYDKIWHEAITMNYLRLTTKIPIPILLVYGKSRLGAFMIVEFIEGEPLSEYLRELNDNLKIEAPHVLGPKVNIQNLRLVYRPMAEILSQLYDLDFPEIGGYIGTSKPFLVPPITRARTEIFRFANVPEKMLSPHARFKDASQYLTSRAEDLMYHFILQANNAILDEDDCQKKFIARCLFRRVAGRISTTFAKGPFKLYCDGFGPSNVLVDQVLNVRAVVGWEFTYAAPVEFAHCSPWWLLLTAPEDEDDEGLDNFLVQYEARHKIFIEVLREYEIERERSGHALKERLSDHMARSLETGNVWVLAAASSAYTFDRIFWKFIYPKYYGHLIPGQDLRDLLTSGERNRMGAAVSVKMKQKERGVLHHSDVPNN